MAVVKTTNFTVRLDAEKKAEAEKLFADLGMTLSGAFNIFLNQCLMYRDSRSQSVEKGQTRQLWQQCGKPFNWPEIPMPRPIHRLMN